jgi:hypothetical protein
LQKKKRLKIRLRLLASTGLEVKRFYRFTVILFCGGSLKKVLRVLHFSPRKTPVHLICIVPLTILILANNLPQQLQRKFQSSFDSAGLFIVNIGFIF